MENLREKILKQGQEPTQVCHRSGNGQGKTFLRSGKRQGDLLWFRQNIDILREVRDSWNLTALFCLC